MNNIFNGRTTFTARIINQVVFKQITIEFTVPVFRSLNLVSNLFGSFLPIEYHFGDFSGRIDRFIDDLNDDIEDEFV